MRFKVPEHRGDLRSSREESGEGVGRDPREGEVVTLSIKHADDLIEAHEITDEGQILATAGLTRVHEGSNDDGAEFTNVTHVNATHTRIERERPAQGSVRLLLRSHGACEVLVEERRDDECMIRKPRVLDYRIDLSLAGKVRNIELAPLIASTSGSVDQTTCLTPASLAACTAAAPCLRSSVPSNEEVVTRNTPYAPLNAAARV